MKFIYTLILSLALTISGFAQDAFYIKYETAIKGGSEDAKTMAGMMNGSTMEVAASKESTWVKTEMGGLMTMTMGLDTASKKVLMVMTGMGANMAFDGNMDELKEENPADPEATTQLFDETKKILGYTCRKATITDSKGTTVTHWYTDKIPRPEGVTQMSEQFPGMSLEFEVTMDGDMRMIYTAVEAKKNISMDDYKVTVPDGVEVQSLSEMIKNGGGGR